MPARGEMAFRRDGTPGLCASKWEPFAWPRDGRELYIILKLVIVTLKI